MQSQVGLGTISTNKASGGDGIPVELFQILKDDAVKELSCAVVGTFFGIAFLQDWNEN